MMQLHHLILYLSVDSSEEALRLIQFQLGCVLVFIGGIELEEQNEVSNEWAGDFVLALVPWAPQHN